MTQKKEVSPSPKGRAKPASPSDQPLSLAHRWPIASWEREIDRWFDDFRQRFGFPRPWSPEMTQPLAGLEVPAVDVYDKDTEIVVKADLPGLSKDEIEVNLTDSQLTLKGEKKREEEVQEGDYYRCERAYGSFVRRVQLPADVKAEEATASFKDGVLEIRLPKTEVSKRKAVKVNVQ